MITNEPRLQPCVAAVMVKKKISGTDDSPGLTLLAFEDPT